MVLERTSDKDFFRRIYPEELWKKYGDDWRGLMRHYQDSYEWIYHDTDRVYRIDTELKALGIESNRTVEALERLIALLDDAEHAESARKLLDPYALESFETAEQWRTWFAANRERIFFSDIGGYKFRVIPKGYLDPAPATQTSLPTTQPQQVVPAKSKAK